ncbi:hypothetical protein [Cytobacillus praedii]|uniref:Uncharacterized protein n=1 Tax=Cytobacillus praedii TaxID=1742358 RepID=A0A4R1ATN0_9BACI|nr:hypothetical protein [Cytobacillus praedii]TCJ01581.1 hypothetical protein E0Y62_23400 [Cytobacillus praedii]
MSKHVVVRAFIDKESKERYSAGEIFESDNQDRISFLQDKGFLDKEQKEESTNSENTPNADSNNDEEEIDQYHIGGGYYEFPNGIKVRGKEKAVETLAEIKAGE